MYMYMYNEQKKKKIDTSFHIIIIVVIVIVVIVVQLSDVRLRPRNAMVHGIEASRFFGRFPLEYSRE